MLVYVVRSILSAVMLCMQGDVHVHTHTRTRTHTHTHTHTQAATAITGAFAAGCTKQRIELSLPLIGATDLDDWPGGIRQQFKSVQPLVEQILKLVKQVRTVGGFQVSTN